MSTDAFGCAIHLKPMTFERFSANKVYGVFLLSIRNGNRKNSSYGADAFTRRLVFHYRWFQKESADRFIYGRRFDCYTIRSDPLREYTRNCQLLFVLSVDAGIFGR